jgi:hypothetical protein
MLIQEYLNLKEQAWKEVKQGESYSYRYGQAVWNLLPKEVSDKIYLTDEDFFQWPNNRFHEIDMICYRLCEDWVEPETWLSTELPNSI